MASSALSSWQVRNLVAKQPPPFPLHVLIEQVSSQHESACLASVGRCGIEVEVGPTPQSVVRADVVASTERCVRLLLRYLELHAIRTHLWLL